LFSPRGGKISYRSRGGSLRPLKAKSPSRKVAGETRVRFGKEQQLSSRCHGTNKTFFREKGITYSEDVSILTNIVSRKSGRANQPLRHSQDTLGFEGRPFSRPAVLSMYAGRKKNMIKPRNIEFKGTVESNGRKTAASFCGGATKGDLLSSSRRRAGARKIANRPALSRRK